MILARGLYLVFVILFNTFSKFPSSDFWIKIKFFVLDILDNDRYGYLNVSLYRIMRMSYVMFTWGDSGRASSQTS